MTIKELIEILSEEDQGRLVVMAKDGEGNAFSPLSEIGAFSYHAESTWSGEITPEPLSEADYAAGWTDKDMRPGGVPALVLWPVN